MDDRSRHGHDNRASNKQARSEQVSMSVAWFPSDQWVEAIRRWPELLEHNPADHVAYSRQTEAKLKAFRTTGRYSISAISPVTIDELIETAGDKAGESSARAELAATMNREGRAIAWPPGRNDPCWCGSGKKYKVCCGPVPPEPDPR